MRRIFNYLGAISCCILASAAVAAATTITVPVNFTATAGPGASAGTVEIIETKYGLLFMPNLHSMAPGIHGFHIHENPSCGDDGMGAGGHLDPLKTGKHLGPYNDNGHLGDLPALYVKLDGTVTTPVVAPRLRKIANIKNHALMIHEGGDSYSDKPEKLGGGGARMVCGIIK